MSASFNSYDKEYERQHREDVIGRVREKMHKEGIERPVRVEFERLPTDDTFVGITPVGKSGNIWLVAPEPGKRRTGNAKVERMAGGAWTCSHPGWKPKEDCIHISRVRYMLGESGVIPYDGRRRRILTATVYPEGPPEDTRLAHARAAEPARVRDLAAQLCAQHTEEPSREQTHAKNRGANGAPYSARAYALLMKVFWNLTYEQLGCRIGQDWTMCEVLGYNKAESPSKRTLIRWFGDPLLTVILGMLFIATTAFTKRFDTMVLGDSHDIPTRMVDNSRDRKFGSQPSSYRNPNRELVRQHFTVGKVSGIIYAADTTLRVGDGTNDSIYLPGMLQRTRDRSETAVDATFDRAYGGHANFEQAEDLGFDLYVREKQGEDRMKPSWPAMARRLTELERTKPVEFAEMYRYRSKAEGTPSRIKVRNSYVRLRRRRSDPKPAFPVYDKEKRHGDLPPEVQDAIQDAARVSVGIARLNESLAILIVANLRALNLMEHRYNQRVAFDKNEPVSLNPPLEIPERELVTVP